MLIAEPLRLETVLNTMEERDEKGNPIPFSISVVTCDIAKRKGGEVISWDKAVICSRTPQEKKLNPAPVLSESGVKRSPNHFNNSTRNIMQLGTPNIRKIHIRLITKFNGHKVKY